MSFVLSIDLSRIARSSKVNPRSRLCCSVPGVIPVTICEKLRKKERKKNHTHDILQIYKISKNKNAFSTFNGKIWIPNFTNK